MKTLISDVKAPQPGVKRNASRAGGRSTVAAVMRIGIKCAPLYIMFAPVFLYYVLFVYLPMAGIVIAFKDYNFVDGIWRSKWVGFDNFARFVSNRDFLKVLRNTVVINLYRVLFGFPPAIIFALMLNEVRSRTFKKAIQTISYLPHFISWVIVAGLLHSFLSVNVGIVNTFIKLGGRAPIFFLGDPRYFRAILVSTNIWKELGWSAIIYLAALAGVEVSLYEAAVIDGANRWRLLWHVTLPSIRSVISIMFILTVGNIMNTGFDQVLVLINSLVADVGEILDFYVYRVGITQVNNYSYAAAVGLFKGAISLALILFTNWSAKKIDENGGIW